MRVYIDYDDVICETAKHFTTLAKTLFDIEVPYNEIRFFDLQKAFGLNATQYDEMMCLGHTPENLLAFEETPYASAVINKWMDEGHEISVVTGRPYEAFETSRAWLDDHGLDRAPLLSVDKYGRKSKDYARSYGMTPEQLYRMPFDFAIEDSPAAFEHVLHFRNCTTAVFDRPWNRQCDFPSDSFIRCRGWLEIDKIFETLRGK